VKKYVLTNNPIAEFSIDYEKELNPQQYQAVTCTDGTILVLAGAGSGKTRTVTYRVARLIESGMSPNAMLLVTFTNKAAREMLQRVESVLKTNLRGLWGGTFHHIGNILLRRHSDLLGYKLNFSILDQEDSKDLVETCVTELGIDRKKWQLPKAGVLHSMVSLSVNTGETIEQVIAGRMPHFIGLTDKVVKIASLYRSKKVQLNLMDFDDLLTNWLRLLEERPEILERYGSQFQQILVDEYQDTNHVQSRLIDMMASVHGNIFVVGDDAQSIYSFRGANFANIISFPKRYPDVKMFKLTTNYRSTPQILSLANSSIRLNHKQFAKDLRAVRPDGELPSLLPVRDVYQQARFVVQRIRDMHAVGKPFREMAVLYRSHYHSMEVQMELTKHSIPFEIRSGLRFFEQAHIKDVTAYMRIVVNPSDELAWMRVLKLMPGVGKVTAQKIAMAAIGLDDPLDGIINGAADKFAKRKNMRAHFGRFLELLTNLRRTELLEQPSEMIREIVKGGYKEYLFATYPNANSRIEDIDQLAEYSRGYHNAEELLSELTLLGTMGEEDTDDSVENDRVILTSIHQSKGLEWSAVFLIWLCEGRFPSPKATSPEDEEEERRLFYVSSTRARDELYMLCPGSSSGYDGLSFFNPSRFILELPQDVYERCEVQERHGYGY